MQFFTPQFKKDLIVSILFLLGVYYLINNPITRPEPQPAPGNWSIILMQHPLLLGLAGHNYLVLKDGEGKIRHEFHGLATDPTTKEWKYVGTREEDLLMVWEFTGSKKYTANKTLPGRVLFQGTEKDAEVLWSKGRVCKDQINTQNRSYPPFGVAVHGDTENSNSVAYTLTRCMGMEYKHIGWFTPGSDQNLLQE